MRTSVVEQIPKRRLGCLPSLLLFCVLGVIVVMLLVAIYLSFSPSTASSHILPGASDAGAGWLCTPQGQDRTLKTYRESQQTNRNALLLPVVLTEADWWSVFASCPKMRGQ